MNQPSTPGQPQNKPLYSDQERGIAVFPDYVTNPATKETSEYFTYVEGKGENAIRIGRIPTTIGGYELQNNQAKGYSDVVDLIDGKELVRHGVGKDATDQQAREYTQIIAPLGVDDVPRKNQPDVSDKRLELYIATAYLRKGAEFDQEGRPNVESFNIHSAGAGQEEGAKRDLKCWRHIPIEGSKNPRTGKPRWFELRVSDALKARDAIAKGEKFSFEHNGVKVTCEGINTPPPAVGEEKQLKPSLQFKAEQLAQHRAQGEHGVSGSYSTVNILRNTAAHKAQGIRGSDFGYRGGGTHDGNSVPDPSLLPLPEDQAATKSAQVR